MTVVGNTAVNTGVMVSMQQKFCTNAQAYNGEVGLQFCLLACCTFDIMIV